MEPAGWRMGVAQTREEWIAGRRGRIGASDVPAILGLVKWRSPYRVWAEMRGLIPKRDETLYIRAGHALEPLVAELYAEQAGRELADPGEYTVYMHPDYPWLGVTPDRLVAGDTAPVELKTGGEYAMDEWRDDAPTSYQVQLQTQIACLGAEWGSLAGLIGNREFRWFDYPRHDRLIKSMIPRLAEFWERVQNGDPPPVDGSDSTTQTLRLLHPRDTGEVITLGDAAIAVWERRARVKAQLKQLEELLAEDENLIRAWIGDASEAQIGTAVVTYKYQTRRGVVTLKPAAKANAHEVIDRAREVLREAGVPVEVVVSPDAEFRVMRERKGGKS